MLVVFSRWKGEGWLSCFEWCGGESGCNLRVMGRTSKIQKTDSYLIQKLSGL